jgi:hypothetical protein
MKNKSLLFCMTLSLFLALSGCRKNEIPQEDVTYDQSLPNDNPIDESSDNSKNNYETNNKIPDNSSQSIDDHNPDSSDEPSNIPDHSSESAYFLSTNHDFYEKAAFNPVDRNYVMDYEAAPPEFWKSALAKCEAWNQQIDFTGSELKGLLSKTDYDQLQNAISLWQEYYQEEVYQSRELYGPNAMIGGSMYTAISGDLLIEKCKLISFILLSQEYELSGNVSFAEDTAAASNDNDYSFSPQSFCIEYSSDFEETLIPYSINEKNSDELEALIHETATTIEETFGHDYAEHANKYVSFIHALYTIENHISEDSNQCLLLKENRLRLYAIELLNIVYMMDVMDSQ